MVAPLFLAGTGATLVVSITVGVATASLLHGAAALTLCWLAFALYIMRRLSHPSWCVPCADPAREQSMTCLGRGFAADAPARAQESATQARQRSAHRHRRRRAPLPPHHALTAGRPGPGLRGRGDPRRGVPRPAAICAALSPPRSPRPAVHTARLVGTRAQPEGACGTISLR